MRVLVFGGNRFVGPRVVRILVRSGNAVTVVHRSPAMVPGVTTISGDRTERGVVEEALATQPDAILDMSLYSAAAARPLVVALAGSDVRYVAVSSAAIYSQDAPTPWEEDTPVDPAAGWGAYGAGKAASDAVLLGGTLPNALLVRPPYVVGAGDPDDRCGHVLARARDALPVVVPGDGTAMIQLIDADDMAEILVEALRSSATGVVNVPGCQAISVREFSEQCYALASDAVELRHAVEHADEYRPDLWPFPNLSLWVSGRRFAREFAARPRPLEELLARALADWRALNPS
jgi:2'-hydroxyisoflavone reductase